MDLAEYTLFWRPDGLFVSRLEFKLTRICKVVDSENNAKNIIGSFIEYGCEKYQAILVPIAGTDSAFFYVVGTDKIPYGVMAEEIMKINARKGIYSEVSGRIKTYVSPNSVENPVSAHERFVGEGISHLAKKYDPSNL